MIDLSIETFFAAILSENSYQNDVAAATCTQTIFRVAHATAVSARIGDFQIIFQNITKKNQKINQLRLSHYGIFQRAS
jgi:hypothetical protein